MARRHWFNPVSIARIAIAATMFFGPVGRYFALATIGTLRGWSMQPAQFWRPLTVISLVVAALAAVFWPYFNPGVYQAVTESEFSSGFGYITVCYVFWSLALVPHNIVRILQLIRERRKQGPSDKSSEMRSDGKK